MPTGFTDNLLNKKFDVKKWMIESIPRAFGILISMKEMEMNIGEKGILKVLEDEINENYDSKEKEKVEKRLKEYESFDNKEWENRFENAKVKIEMKNNIYLKKWEKEKEDFIDAKFKVKKLHDANKILNNEIIKNIIQFALDQIEDTLSHDYNSPYLTELPKNKEDYKLIAIKAVEHDIEYRRKEGNKSRILSEKRLEEYKNYSEFVKRNFLEEE